MSGPIFHRFCSPIFSNPLLTARCLRSPHPSGLLPVSQHHQHAADTGGEDGDGSGEVSDRSRGRLGTGGRTGMLDGDGGAVWINAW